MNDVSMCANCGATEKIYDLKRGWNNARYCSESCERHGVSLLHESMPGAGPLAHGRLPAHISKEISNRWEV